MRKALLAGSLAAVLALGGMACGDEGPAEKAGRDIDEAMEDVAESGEGLMEEAGRKLDTTMEDAEEAAEEARREMEEKME